jgi:hypothetical protein
MSFWKDFKKGISVGRRISLERSFGQLSQPMAHLTYRDIERHLISTFYGEQVSRGAAWGIRLGDNLGLAVFCVLCLLVMSAWWLMLR